MGLPAIQIVQAKEDRVLYGLSCASSDRMQSRDIPTLSKAYYRLVGKNSGEVLPFFVVSKEYDQKTGVFRLFIGGLEPYADIERMVIPKGIYGQMSVQPALGFLWGSAIGRTKRYFYLKWLPSSGYEALNLEYEEHNEKSVGRKPAISLLFGIRHHEENAN